MVPRSTRHLLLYTSQSAKDNQDKVPAGALVFYGFREGTGQVVRDTSGIGTRLHLPMKDALTVQWLPGGGLRIAGRSLIASSGPATKVAEAVKRSRAITIEAWIRPENAFQAGSGRIVTLSRDMGGRNATLGQEAA